MKKILSLYIFFFCSCTFAQELTIPVKFLSGSKNTIKRYVGTDAFGWTYTITDNEFRKENNDRIVKYKSLQLGDIYRVDLQNPLQIVLFYKDFNTAVLLDNQLNETARINFSDLTELTQPIIAEAASLASQNRLWVYDITTQQIGLYDPAQNNFKTITPQLSDGIKYYQSDYNYFYWIDAAGKVYRVNLFGKVSFLGSVQEYNQIQFVSPSQVLLKKDEALFLYNLISQSSKRIEIKEKSFKSFHYKEQILSIFTNSDINQYKITITE